MGSVESRGQQASTRILRVGIDRATLRGRWLGTRLREYREAAGLKGAKVAERVGRSIATISKWETGDVIPGPSEIYHMLDIYGVSAEERDTLMRHADEARQPGFSEVDVSDVVTDQVWLESRTWKVETFRTSSVHGLLQTREYAREVLIAWNPTETPERIDGTLTVREARQRRLIGDDPLQLSAILDEAVLRRLVGGPTLMRTQLEFLIERAALPNVEIRVIPYAAGAHASLTGAFDLLHFSDQDDVVYVESRGGVMYLDKAEPYIDALRRLDAVALPTDESLAIIAQIARETR